MATFRGMPARSRFRTAERRMSWGMRRSILAAVQAVVQGLVKAAPVDRLACEVEYQRAAVYFQAIATRQHGPERGRDRELAPLAALRDAWADVDQTLRISTCCHVSLAGNCCGRWPRTCCAFTPLDGRPVRGGGPQADSGGAGGGHPRRGKVAADPSSPHAAKSCAPAREDRSGVGVAEGRCEMTSGTLTTSARGVREWWRPGRPALW